MSQPTHRGRSPELNRRVYGRYVYITDNAPKHQHRIYEYNKERNYTIDRSIDPKSLGRNTGLTDKSGKEIYEGDIVRYGRNMPVLGGNMGVIPDGDFKENICEVVVGETLSCYLYDKEEEDFFDINIEGIEEDLEKIGNIHQNPNLQSD